VSDRLAAWLNAHRDYEIIAVDWNERGDYLTSAVLGREIAGEHVTYGVHGTDHTLWIAVPWSGTPVRGPGWYRYHRRAAGAPPAPTPWTRLTADTLIYLDGAALVWVNEPEAALPTALRWLRYVADAHAGRSSAEFEPYEPAMMRCPALVAHVGGRLP
jgi:hypothetical protein